QPGQVDSGVGHGIDEERDHGRGRILEPGPQNEAGQAHAQDEEGKERDQHVERDGARHEEHLVLVRLVPEPAGKLTEPVTPPVMAGPAEGRQAWAPPSSSMSDAPSSRDLSLAAVSREAVSRAASMPARYAALDRSSFRSSSD